PAGDVDEYLDEEAPLEEMTEEATIDDLGEETMTDSMETLNEMERAETASEAISDIADEVEAAEEEMAEQFGESESDISDIVENAQEPLPEADDYEVEPADTGDAYVSQSKTAPTKRMSTPVNETPSLGT